jgi:hypothetical protein
MNLVVKQALQSHPTTRRADTTAIEACGDRSCAVADLEGQGA